MLIQSWYNQNTIHPVGLAAVILLGVALLCVPRRFALVPLLVLACCIPPAQRIVVATLDFNFMRVLIFLGWVRIMLRGETAGWWLKPIDSVVVLWAVCAAVMATLLRYTLAELILRLGFLYDVIGLYFLCRVLVRDWSDVRTFVQCVAVISIPIAIAFLVERATARNMFTIFGGVPEVPTVRGGRHRCQGPFAHPILAGCFWAGLMPLIGTLWWFGKWNRVLSVIGLAGSMVVVITCASATALNGMLFGGIAMGLFPLRRWMSWMRWAGVITLVGLQLVMINPIWHLFVRMSSVGGATGWYRFKLFDEFIRNIDDWWMMGTESYPSWWEYGLADITNEYVRQGVQGGALTLGLFVAIIIVGFISVGRICRRAGWHAHRVTAWALGVSLFIHCIVFTSVSYFGHSILAWYMTIGLIGCLTPARQRDRTAHARLTRPAGSGRAQAAFSRATIPITGA